MYSRFFLALILAVSNWPTSSATATTTISSTTNWGTWDGWGVSLAWWAKAFGTNDDLAEIFFTTNEVTWGSQSLPGLGFNIARYNAGACSWNTYDNASMVVSPKMIPSRQMSGYWLDWASSDPSSSSWAWGVDDYQVDMLQKAQSNGANIFELFSDSPMWWMCYNHNPSGSDDGKSDNLQSWNYDQHAVYLATIAKYAADNWGITFTSVEAFNEPSADYWTATGTQEGCHFDYSTMSQVIPNLRTELNNRGLTSTIVSASDEEQYDLAIYTFGNLTSAALSDVGRINVHGYQYGGGRRDILYADVHAAGKKLWLSEYGENVPTGLNLTSNLILDFRWLHPTAWVYWQAVDGGGWGLIDGDNDAVTTGAASQKYFVLAQFTRHIRQGMRILDAGADYAVAAYDSSAQKLIIVAVNWGDAQYLNFDLSQFSQPGVNGALVPRWSTQIGDSGDQYVEYSDTYMSGTKFWSYFGSDVIMSFEVSNVVL